MDFIAFDVIIKYTFIFHFKEFVSYAAGKNELLDYIIKLNLNIFSVLTGYNASSELLMINLKALGGLISK
jgi:hypothetical protein